MSHILRLNGLKVRFNENATPVLTDLKMMVGAGECHCITGPTGSGKSTLLRAIAGLLPPESHSGEIVNTTPPGVVFQNPTTQILCDHVGKETAFALENRGDAPESMPSKVARALTEADLNIHTHTATTTLSMGRQYRLILAGALVTEPSLLLLDEPCAQLDANGCKAVAAVINRVRSRGGAVILCEHDPAPLSDCVTHWWCIKDGRLLSATASFDPPAASRSTPLEDKDSSPFLTIGDLHLSLGDKTIFNGLELTVRPGEAIHVEGPNGTGKSTLTRVLSGFLPPDKGNVTLFGKPVAPARLRGRVGLVLQSPLSQLFEDTVRLELAFAARRKRLDDINDRARAMAEQLGIADQLDRAPHLLSYGTQRLVALGACLTQEPDMLILDDPFAGLDKNARERIRLLLMRERRERGMGVLITGHNPPSPLRFADFYTRELRLEGGRLAPVV